jgi:hypothetical protein
MQEHSLPFPPGLQPRAQFRRMVARQISRIFPTKGRGFDAKIYVPFNADLK